MPIKNYGSHKVCINNYTIRMETHQARPHIVVPIIMMIPGVHAGSHGPLLHSEEALSKFPASWNGIPVTISHPKEDGHPVSANSPAIIDTKTVGRIYNADFVDNKLRAEAWLDEQRLQQVSLATLEALRQGRILEVSVGVFTEDQHISGYWNGKQYEGIAQNHRPDHCAILDLTAGEIGACAVVDGCGVRTNEKGGVMADISEAKVSLEDVLKGLQPGDYRLKYDGSVEPIENHEHEVKIMAEKEKGKEPCCPEKVELLIQSGAFVEQDRDWLLGLTVNDMAKVQAALDSCTTKMAGMQAKMDKMMGANKSLDPPPAMNQEQAIQVLKDQFSDPDKALALFPHEIQENLRHGLNLYRAQRTEMIKKITTNTDVYTAEELAPLSMEALDKLARAILPKTDFTPLGGGNSNPAAYEGEALLPPGVE